MPVTRDNNNTIITTNKNPSSRAANSNILALPRNMTTTRLFLFWCLALTALYSSFTALDTPGPLNEIDIIASNDEKGMTPSSPEDLGERMWKSQRRRFEALFSLFRWREHSSNEEKGYFGLSRAAATSSVAFSPTSESGNKYKDPNGIARTGTTFADPDLFINATTIYLVLSARSNFDRRHVARATWASGHTVYYVVGGTPDDKSIESSDVQGKLVKEQELHKDLLNIRHPESYSSLPHKIKLAYQWVVHNLPAAKWIVKVDDDTIARVETLERAFLRFFNAEVPIVLGRIIPRSGVNKEGKWAEHKYPSSFYPYWPMGSCGHVVSRPVAQYIASMKDPIYYQGEDTSIGIWLDESPLQVTWIRSPYFVNGGNCMNRQFIVIGHQITPEQMQACFAASDEWSKDDIRQRSRNLFHVDSQEQRPVWDEGGPIGR